MIIVPGKSITQNTVKILNNQLSKYKIPDHITKVLVYLYDRIEDMDDNLLYRGVDSSGKIQYIYGKNYATRRTNNKLNVLETVVNNFKVIHKYVTSNINKYQDRNYNSISALMIAVAFEFYIRIGKLIYMKQNNTYGLTTLKKKHFKLSQSTITLSFTGKDNINHKYLIPIDSILFSPLKYLINNTKNLDDFIFRYEYRHNLYRLSENNINTTLYNITNDSNVTIKSIRMFGANKTFLSCKLKGNNDKVCLSTTAKTIRHTEAISKKSYIVDEFFKLPEDIIKKINKENNILNVIAKVIKLIKK